MSSPDKAKEGEWNFLPDKAKEEAWDS